MPYGRESVGSWIEVRMNAVGMKIQCNRIDRGSTKLDLVRSHLVDVGESIVQFLDDFETESLEGDEERPEYKGLLSNVASPELAREVISKYFNDSDDKDVLRSVGEVLKTANNPRKFDDKASLLGEMFNEWASYAEEKAYFVKRDKRGYNSRSFAA